MQQCYVRGYLGNLLSLTKFGFKEGMKRDDHKGRLTQPCLAWYIPTHNISGAYKYCHNIKNSPSGDAVASYQTLHQYQIWRGWSQNGWCGDCHHPSTLLLLPSALVAIFLNLLPLLLKYPGLFLTNFEVIWPHKCLLQGQYALPAKFELYKPTSWHKRGSGGPLHWPTQGLL